MNIVETFDLSITPEEAENIKVEFNEATKSGGGRKKLTKTIAALHEGITRNKTEYHAEELRASIPTWTTPYNKPIIKDHGRPGMFSRDELVDDIIGRVEEAYMANDNGVPTLMHKVSIMDPDAIEKILDGRYSTVSVGVSCKHAVCSVCGNDMAANEACGHERGHYYLLDESDPRSTKMCTWILSGISGGELSFVVNPSDVHAGIRNSADDSLMDLDEAEFQAFHLEDVTDVDDAAILAIESEIKGYDMEDEKQENKNTEPGPEPGKEEQLIAVLNEILMGELQAYVQYRQHGIMMDRVSGMAMSDTFFEVADVEADHAQEVAERVDFLGGIATTTLAPIEGWQDGWTVENATEAEIKAEKTAIAQYKSAMKLAEDLGDVATARLCEDHVQEEEGHLYQFMTIAGKDVTDVREATNEPHAIDEVKVRQFLESVFDGKDDYMELLTYSSEAATTEDVQVDESEETEQVDGLTVPEETTIESEEGTESDEETDDQESEPEDEVSEEDETTEDVDDLSIIVETLKTELRDVKAQLYVEMGIKDGVLEGERADLEAMFTETSESALDELISAMADRRATAGTSVSAQIKNAGVASPARKIDSDKNANAEKKLASVKFTTPTGQHRVAVESDNEREPIKITIK